MLTKLFSMQADSVLSQKMPGSQAMQPAKGWVFSAQVLTVFFDGETVVNRLLKLCLCSWYKSNSELHSSFLFSCQ